MSILNHKTSIEDIENHNCTDAEITHLCDIFSRKIKVTAQLQAHTACFDLVGMASAKQHGLEQFSLVLKQSHQYQNQWHGMFTAQGKWLKILGSIENV